MRQGRMLLVGDIEELGPLVHALRRDRRRHPYAGRREMSAAARELAVRCAALIDAGRAAEVQPDLRRAVGRLTTALQYVDDSSGVLGGDLRDLTAVYAQACRQAPPAPKTLAAWLVRLEFDGPGWPEVVLADFAPALGERGLAHVAALVDERAAQAGEDSWSHGYAVQDLREQLAHVSGDVDRYVAVLAEHLDHADQYQRIAEALREAGRRAEALEWVRRGMSELGDSFRADELRGVLVDLLVAEGQPEAAVAVRRDDFERRPTAAAYLALVDVSQACDVPVDEQWAVDVLRARAASAPAALSELVTVLLAQGREDTAWSEAEPRLAELREPLQLVLLELQAARHARDVIGHYQRLVQAHVLDSRDKHRYRRAIDLLPAMQRAYRDTDDPEGFAAYLAELRTEHRRRPTFLAALDRFRGGGGRG